MKMTMMGQILSSVLHNLYFYQWLLPGLENTYICPSHHLSYSSAYKPVTAYCKHSPSTCPQRTMFWIFFSPQTSAQSGTLTYHISSPWVIFFSLYRRQKKKMEACQQFSWSPLSSSWSLKRQSQLPNILKASSLFQGHEAACNTVGRYPGWGECGKRAHCFSSTLHTMQSCSSCNVGISLPLRATGKIVESRLGEIRTCGKLHCIL